MPAHDLKSRLPDYPPAGPPYNKDSIPKHPPPSTHIAYTKMEYSVLAHCPLYAWQRCCMSMLYTHAAYPCCINRLRKHVAMFVHVLAACLCFVIHVHAACPCCMPCCVSMLHVHASCLWMSALFVHAVYPCCMSLLPMLYVHAAFTCCIYMLHVHAACPCCMSMLHVHAAFTCCMSMLQAYVARPSCMPLQHANAACSCSMQHVPIWPCCKSFSPCPVLQSAANFQRLALFFTHLSFRWTLPLTPHRYGDKHYHFWDLLLQEHQDCFWFW